MVLENLAVCLLRVELGHFLASYKNVIIIFKTKNFQIFNTT